MSEEWTTLRVLDWTTERFTKAGYKGARLEAQVLLAHALECDRVGLYTMFDKPLDSAELAAFHELIKRRLSGEPVAYLVQKQEFWSLSLRVDARVLIPRRDTETVVEAVLDATPDRSAPLRIADVATGSGALAIALARELTRATVIATDVSADAVELATENAARNNVADRVELRKGDLLEPLAGEAFDIIVANLPYIPTADIDELSEEVRYEPRAALDGGADGLELFRRLIPDLRNYLVDGGFVALEHGFDQADALASLIRQTAAFSEPELRRDLGDRPRVTCARRR